MVNDAASSPSRAIVAGAPQRPPCVILVVDDEVPITLLLRDILVDEGYIVLTAPEGQSALALTATAHPDLIITDLMMPGMDGRGLCAQIHAQAPTADIPVVVMSAAYRPQPSDSFAAAIAKPFNIDQLLAVVTTCLSHA